MELSVIIVNYNGLKYLEGCFNTLYENLDGITSEIIVVDNASADGSVEFIKKNYPAVVLIESRENLGFGKGNNLGVENAKGEYVLLINNDTLMQDHIRSILDAVKADKNIGAMGIKMLDRNGQYLNAVGKFPNPDNLYRIKNMFRLGPEFKTGVFLKEKYEVDWLSGAFLMMPKKVYDEVGGFDKDYFMYVEDVDICKKIADRGYKRIFLPQYSYIHFVGHNLSKDHYLIRGCELYIQKHHRGIKRMLSMASLQINKIVKRLKGRTMNTKATA